MIYYVEIEGVKRPYQETEDIPFYHKRLVEAESIEEADEKIRNHDEYKSHAYEMYVTIYDIKIKDTIR